MDPINESIEAQLERLRDDIYTQATVTWFAAAQELMQSTAAAQERSNRRFGQAIRRMRERFKT